MKKARRIGVATLATLAFAAAIGTTTASAGAFEVFGPTELKGTATTTQIFTGGPEFKCDGSFTGFTSQAETETLSTTSLSYTNCNATKFDTKNCQLIFHPGYETSPGTFDGTFDIGPSNCGPISITYLSSCNVSYYPTTGQKATFTNTGSGNQRAVVITLSAENLKYEKKEGTCGATGTNGTYTGTMVMKGYVSGKESGVKVIGQPAPGPGIHVESGSFRAEAYPRPITASQTSQVSLTTPGGEVKCTGNLGATLAAQSSTLSLTPAFSACTAFGFSATVAMNSCRYDLVVTSGTVGTMDVACSKGGDKITVSPKFFGYPLCTMQIPAQTLAGAVYQNTGSGKSQHVVTPLEGSGIQYEGSSSVCGSAGLHEDGTLQGTLDLVGT